MEQPSSGRDHRIIYLIVVAAVAFGVFSQTLSYSFCWDDNWLIIDNSRIDDPTYVRYMLFERDGLWRPLKRISFMLDYYLWGPDSVDEPSNLSDRLKGATGFHLTNVLIQTGACLALYAFVCAIGLRPEVAAATAILFAVHPIHVESVANISHRKEPMSLLFTLLAFIAYIRARSEPVRFGPVAALYRLLSPKAQSGTIVMAIMAAPCGYAALTWSAWVATDAPRAQAARITLAVLCLGFAAAAAMRLRLQTAARLELALWTSLSFMCGMLSKEVGAVMLPILIVVYELFVRIGIRESFAIARRILTGQERFPLPAALLATTIPVLALFTISGYLGRLKYYFEADKYEWISEAQIHTYGPVFLSAIKSLAVSFKLLLWPSPLYLDRKFELAESMNDLGVGAGFLLIAVFAAAMVATAVRARYVFFALAWMVLTMLPVTNFIPLTHWWTADRFLYVPSVGFALLIALALDAIAEGRLKLVAGDRAMRRTVAVATFMIIVLVHAGLTLKQNPVWTNSRTLWERTLEYNDHSYRALHGYGLELSNAGEKVEAQKYYLRSIEANPSYPEPRYALALLKLEMGEYDEAIKHAEVHARLKSGDPETYMVIGNSEFGRKDYSAASRAYSRAVDYSPTHSNALFNLANVSFALRRHDSALTAIEQALVNRGQDDEFVYLRGRILQALNRDDEALEAYQLSMLLDRKDTDPLNASAEILIRRKEYAHALDLLEQSLALDADQSRVIRTVEWLQKRL